MYSDSFVLYMMMICTFLYISHWLLEVIQPKNVEHKQKETTADYYPQITMNLNSFEQLCI